MLMQLALQNINKSFGNHIVFQNLSFDFSNCGFYLLCGKSGSGKSTLLNILAGYEDIESGQRIVDASIHITSIFQTYELIDELTVYENLKMIEDIYHEDVSMDTIMLQLGLQEIKDHYPHELSAGQQQRVGIARALMQKPQVIICDEPTESLDIENKKIVLDLLKKLSATCVVIVASHEQQLMLPYCDYCYEIKDHQLHCLLSSPTNKLPIPPQLQYHQKSIHHYFHQIFHKKMMIMSLILTCLVLIEVVCVQIDHSLFMLEHGKDALNYQSLYITDYRSSLQDIDDYHRLIPFQPVEINHQLKKVNIYPCPDSSRIQDNEIIINKKLADALQQQVGSTIELSYQLQEESYPLTFMIKEIIEEKDVHQMQIYYSYDYLINTLKNTPYSLKYPTQYDLLTDETLSYEIIIDGDIEQAYEQYASQSTLSVYHSVLTDWLIQQKDNHFYHHIFIIVEILIAFLILCFLFYDVFKNMKKNQKNLSIMYSLGIPLSLLKHMYLIKQVKILFIFFMIPVLECLLASLFGIDFSFIMILLILSIMIIYILVLKLRLHALKVTHISSILKISQDES